MVKKILLVYKIPKYREGSTHFLICDAVNPDAYKTVVRPAMMNGAETWAAKPLAETWAVKKACTREEVGCGENEDVEMDVWCYKDEENKELKN